MSKPMNRARAIVVAALSLCVIALGLAAAGCGGDGGGTAGTPVIAVTTPILGSVVKAAVGDAASVEVVMPNGADPHEWRPSAKDVARLEDADLIVENGLGLEAGLTKAISQAKDGGVPVFTATDHIEVRTVKAGEGADPADADQAAGARDPHFWTDPTQVRAVVNALPAAVSAATGADVSASAATYAKALTAADARAASRLASVPPAARAS